jgi:hypothetical protein
MSVFVWTKIGSEAGEGITDIIGRKRDEQAAGNGKFWWGIGTSLGPAVREAAERAGGTIPIVFCEMLGRAQPHDASPKSTVRWAKWRDWNNCEFDVPRFVRVMSRGEDRKGRRKDKHYALICHSQKKIEIAQQGQLFDPRNCRTLSGKIPGDSQNTALLEGDFAQSHPDGRYRIAFVVNLVNPWQATLIR